MTTRSTPELRLTARSFRMGLIVLGVILVALYLTFKAQTGLPFRKTTQVQAVIGNIHSLRVNDDVRHDSKRIGRVSAIKFDHGAALVTMSLDGNVPVYRNASAAIWDVSALATKFVELDYGKPSSGALDAAIPATQNQDSSDLYQLLDVLDPATRANAASTVREVGGGLAGHGTDINNFLATAPDMATDIGTISQSLASPDADLHGLLASTQSLAAHMSGTSAELADLVRQSDQMFQAINVDDGAPLSQTIAELPATLSQVRVAMDTARPALADTGAAMRALAPGASALAASEANLRGFLVDSVPVAGQVPGVANLAVPALEDLTGTLADARPMAPDLSTAFSDLAAPLSVLAPYTPDMASLFFRGRSFVSQGPNANQRYARLGVGPNFNTVTNGLGGLFHYTQDNYPAPGQAQNDRSHEFTGLTLGGKN